MNRHRPIRSAVRPVVVAVLALVSVLALAAAADLVGVRPAEAQRSSSRDARGFLGVRLQDLDDRLRDSYDFKGSGVLVSDVTPGSPADRVGVEDGDILTRLDDRSVSSAAQVTDLVRGLAPGTLVGVWVVRDGDQRYLGRAEIADLASAPDDDTPVAPRAPRAPRVPRAAPAPPSPHDDHEGPGVVREFDFGPGLQGLLAGGRGRLGIEPHDLDGDLGGYFKVPDGHGVLVLDVLDDTPAAAAGLKSGDVITRVGDAKVDDTEDLRRALRDREAGRVDLRVVRGGAERTIAVELKEAPKFDFRSLPGGGNWMGWTNDDGDDEGKSGDGVRKHVFRFKGDGKDGAKGTPRVRVFRNFDDLRDRGGDDLSPEERERFESDMQKLREELRELRRELRDMRDDRR